MKENIFLHSEKETFELAEKIASLLKRESVLTLIGNLGSGKTVFAKGIAKGLNVKQEVTSPTFNILKCYFDGILPFYHIDAYRLEDSFSTRNIGLEEVIDGDGICLVEWPNFISDLINNPLEINIEIVSPSERLFTFFSNNKKYEDVFLFLRGYKNEL